MKNPKKNLFTKANLAKASGRLEDALRLYERHLSGAPIDRDAILNLGDVYIQLERYAEAATLYGEALSQDSKDPLLLSNLGAAMLRLGRVSEARALLEYALELCPTLLFARINLGGVLQAQGETLMALENALEAVKLEPTHPLTFNNLGSAFSDLDMFREAKHAYETSLMLDPKQVDAQVNMATVAMRLYEFEYALSLYESVASQLPAHMTERRDSILFFAAFPAFSLGLWKKAWNYYELGFGILIPQGAARAPNRQFNVPRWNGKAEKGKRLLIWREQGVGDEILFASILPELEKLEMTVIFECEARLVGVWQRCFPWIQARPAIFNSDSLMPVFEDFDYHLPICSLGPLYRRDLPSFKNFKPYIFPCQQRAKELQERVAAIAHGRPRVGILWRSIRLTPTRVRGYTLPSSWEGVLDRKDIAFFSLQYNVTSSEINDAELKFGTKVHHFYDIDFKDDFESAIALISHMDLVISPDTTMFEVAGAMGVPCICMTVCPSGHYGLKEVFPFFPSVFVLTPDSAEHDATDLLKKVPELVDQFVINLSPLNELGAIVDE